MKTINKEANWSEDYIQTRGMSSDHDKNTCKVWKKIGIKLQEELRTQGTHYLYILILFKTDWKMTKFKMPIKYDINLRIKTQPHTYLQTRQKNCTVSKRL